MTDANLYFSRDTKVIVGIGTNYWEIPVLDGYSFSQAQNATEVTLSEMVSVPASAAVSGESRRGRRMFNDSYAPAEWSFSTYVRPFTSQESSYSGPDGVSKAADGAAKVHAVEEVLWGLFAGYGHYDASAFNFKAFNTTPASGVAYTTPASNSLAVSFAQSNTVDLAGVGADIYFILGGTDPSNTQLILNADTSASDTSIVLSTTPGIGIIAPGDVIVITDGTTTTTNTVASTYDNTSGNTGAGRATIPLVDEVGIVAAAASAKVYFDRSVTYKCEGAVVDSASIDFDIDGIATINWSGQARIISQTISPKSVAIATSSSTPAIIDEGTALTTNFIRNRLSTLSIASTDTLKPGGTATTYSLTLTGGNITFSNNISFLTPETLGSVNQPFRAVAGTRSVTGNFTCYLNTGNDSSNDLFKDLVAATTVITNTFDLGFKIGGNTGIRLEVDCNTSHIELPTHSIEDVISMDTSFHALPSNISGTDDVSITYKV